MWKLIKNFLIKFAVRGLVKAGKADLALEICEDIIKELKK